MAKREAVEAIEKSLDKAEDTVHTLERIPKVNLNGTTKHQQVVILGTVAGVAATVGVLLLPTIRFVRRRRQAKKVNGGLNGGYIPTRD